MLVVTLCINNRLLKKSVVIPILTTFSLKGKMLGTDGVSVKSSKAVNSRTGTSIGWRECSGFDPALFNFMAIRISIDYSGTMPLCKIKQVYKCLKNQDLRDDRLIMITIVIVALRAYLQF